MDMIKSFAPPRSAGLKLLLVCFLALVMAIPALFVFLVVYDRSSRADEAAAEIARLQGGQQTLIGPVLAIPYEAESESGGRESGLVFISAETGTADVKLATRTLKRGIHAIPVYDSTARFTARFEPEAEDAPAGAQMDWAGAYLVMAASDLRGATAPATVTVRGQEMFLDPFGGADAARAGRYGAAMGMMATPVDGVRPGAALEVTASTQFSGAEYFALAPFAKQTEAEVAGDWPHPSFGQGEGFLPGDRTVTDDGFTAAWQVPFLARSAPSSWTDGNVLGELAGRPLAVSLVQPANPYQSVQRALKYAAMFTGFVFLAYFLFEITTGSRVHAAQYVLVGLAQAIFYLLLLALAELIGFDLAFLIAAAAVVAQTGLYAGAVFGHRRYAYRALGVFAVIYALMYILMRMEDFALLTGAVASFLAVAAAMWITRDLDWYGGGREAKPSEADRAT